MAGCPRPNMWLAVGVVLLATGCGSLQALGLGLGGQHGGVGGGQVSQPGQDHVHRLGGAGRNGNTHLILTSPGSSRAGSLGPKK